MIIPFPPGGTLDVVGRMLAQKLGEQMRQTFIVDNRPGGAGTIGAIAVKPRRSPTATRCCSAPSTHTTTPMTMKTRAVRRDRRISRRWRWWPRRRSPIAVNKNLPVTDVKSLIAHAKANPGKLELRDRLHRIGRASVDRAAAALQRDRVSDRAVQGLGAGVPGLDRRPDRRLHRSDPRLGAVRQGRTAAA